MKWLLPLAICVAFTVGTATADDKKEKKNTKPQVKKVQKHRFGPQTRPQHKGDKQSTQKSIWGNRGHRTDRRTGDRRSGNRSDTRRGVRTHDRYPSMIPNRAHRPSMDRNRATHSRRPIMMRHHSQRPSQRMRGPDSRLDTRIQGRLDTRVRSRLDTRLHTRIGHRQDMRTRPHSRFFNRVRTRLHEKLHKDCRRLCCK